MFDRWWCRKRGDAECGGVDGGFRDVQGGEEGVGGRRLGRDVVEGDGGGGAGSEEEGIVRVELKGVD